MLVRIKNWISNNIPLVLILCLSMFLLVFRIGYRTFWMDETMILNYFHHGIFDFIVEYIKFPDNHPPLYYFLVLLVSKVLPWSELTVRLISILSGFGIVLLTYRFTYRVTNVKKIALFAAFFTAFSSYFILISQMARYHSFAGFSMLLVMYYFYRLYTEGFEKRVWLYYLGSLILTGYVDYPHFIYAVEITNIFLLYRVMRKRPVVTFKNWFVGNLFAALACLPLAWMLYHRIFIQGDGGWENVNLLGNSIVNIFAGILFHMYVFLFGENIFPWNYIIFIIGCVVLGGILVGLVNLILQRTKNSSQILVVLMCISTIVLNTLFINAANPRYNFTVYPKFGFASYALGIMAFVFCITSFRSKKIQNSFLVGWFLVASIGLYYFYTASNYLNPSYFRTFESFEYVRDYSVQGDHVAITPDASQGFYYFYKDVYFENLKPLSTDDFKLGNIQVSERVWFFSTGEDGPEESVTTEKKIPEGYRIISRFDSVPLDPRFKTYKEKFLNRPSYTYKYTVFLLEKI